MGALVRTGLPLLLAALFLSPSYVTAAAAERKPGFTEAQHAWLAKKGPSYVLRVDRHLNTPRVVVKHDGLLSRASDQSAREIVFDYLKAQRDAFAFDARVQGQMVLVRDYRSTGGVRHLRWRQVVEGVPVFGAGVGANLTASGELINVSGPWIADAKLSRTTPSITAAEARGEIAGMQSSRAQLVAYPKGQDLRLAWHLQSREQEVILDAETRKTLYRQALHKSLAGTVTAHENYPGAPQGGIRAPRLLRPGWLTTPAHLQGENAHAFTDLNGNDAPDAGENVGPTSGAGQPLAWARDLKYTDALGIPFLCSQPWCTWEPKNRQTWSVNHRAAAAQAFYFANRFHDHLEEDPSIEFSPAAGNFEGDDYMEILVSWDAAEPALGPYEATNQTPRNPSYNRASYIGAADGVSAELRFALYANDSVSSPGANPADFAGVVYHEYAHGLNNRTVTRADGLGGLRSPHAFALDEGTADWYALDYLVATQMQSDDPSLAGEVHLQRQLDSVTSIRDDAIDCPAAQQSGNCAHPGRTFADFGNIGSSPEEPHANGEIWGQTLWELRQQLVTETTGGVATARKLVTAALRISPEEPTFIDMRDMILAADQVHFDGDHQDLIWGVFARRGMGVNADALSPSDTEPTASFTFPTYTIEGVDVLSGTLRYVADPGKNNVVHQSFALGESVVGEGADAVPQYRIRLTDSAGIGGYVGNDCLRQSATEVECWGVQMFDLRLGDGDDRFNGSSDVMVPVRIDGDAGADVLIGGSGRDTLRGGAGNDVLRGAGDTDKLYGDAGADQLFGGLEPDDLTGGADIDLVSYRSAGAAGSGNDYDDGRAGNYPITASIDGLANDGQANEQDNIAVDIEELEGDGGNDTLTGGTNDNTLYGGPGNDTLKYSSGADAYNGAGKVQCGQCSDENNFPSDVMDYSAAPSGVVITHDEGDNDGPADDGGYRRDNVRRNTEGVIGSAHGDDINTYVPLMYNLYNGVVRGGAGNDTLAGRYGARLIGGPGADDFRTAYYGTADYSEEAAGVSITLDGQYNDGPNGEDNVGQHMNIYGTPYADTITEGSAPLATPGLEIRGGAGDDTIQTAIGNGYGEAGDDNLRNLGWGSSVYSTLYGGDGDDDFEGPGNMNGEDGADRFKVDNAKNNSLDCGNGSDEYIADSSGDTIGLSCETAVTSFPSWPTWP